MKAQDFLGWMSVVGVKSAPKFADKTGVHPNTAYSWLALARAGEEVPVKRTVALAMSAVAQGLKPWDEYERG